MQSAWSAVKTAAKGKNSSLINQTETSIRDYAAAIQGQRTDQVSSKADIALQNLRSVGKAMTATAASTAGTTKK